MIPKETLRTRMVKRVERMMYLVLADGADAGRRQGMRY
jgi:hypothetical protein